MALRDDTEGKGGGGGRGEAEPGGQPDRVTDLECLEKAILCQASSDRMVLLHAE